VILLLDTSTHGIKALHLLLEAPSSWPMRCAMRMASLWSDW